MRFDPHFEVTCSPAIRCTLGKGFRWPDGTCAGGITACQIRLAVNAVTDSRPSAVAAALSVAASSCSSDGIAVEGSESISVAGILASRRALTRAVSGPVMPDATSTRNRLQDRVHDKGVFTRTAWSPFPSSADVGFSRRPESLQQSLVRGESRSPLARRLEELAVEEHRSAWSFPRAD